MTRRSPIEGVWWLGDLERALGKPGRDILRQRAALEAAGFPRPLPRLKLNERLSWPAHECAEWIAARRAGAPLPANDAGPDPAEAAKLEARRAHLLATM